MPIEIKITGNHATDVVAEIRNLALIMGVADVAVPTPPQEDSVGPRSHSGPEAKAEAKVDTAATSTDKPLTRKEQDEAVKYMINQLEKDDRFQKLTKGRQEEVEAALAKAAEPVEQVKDNDDLDDMFADDVKVVTRDDVSTLMAKVGKDKDGSPIQDKLLKIRAILVDNIPEGFEPKVKNIPEDKLSEVYALIEKIGA